MKNNASLKMFDRAAEVIPGGVNSPVRACKSVGTSPVFIKKASGCFVYDEDGNKYIDYIGSWGPMILGHKHPAVIEAITKVLERGTSFGAPTDLETELAEMVIDAVPSIEMVRFVNSGTEAAMSGIRLARGFTGRDTIIKFDGCYHGHADSLLVESGSGVASLGIPGSPGVPNSFVKHTISLPFNDIKTLKDCMADRGKEIACIIVEPVAGNMGLIKPVEGFLETLRSETEKSGSLLIFDEVMTGFRLSYGGAQKVYGIMPDITILGKIIGGGLPVGAYGGRRDIMEHIAPSGPVYQAGTLSGNPVAMAAGIASLDAISEPGFYDKIEKKGESLEAGLKEAALNAGLKVFVARAGSMLSLFFNENSVKNFDDAKKSDTVMFSKFYREMLQRGIYIAPSQFESLFISYAHNAEHIERTIDTAGQVFSEILGKS